MGSNRTLFAGFSVDESTVRVAYLGGKSTDTIADRLRNGGWSFGTDPAGQFTAQRIQDDERSLDRILMLVGLFGFGVRL